MTIRVAKAALSGRIFAGHPTKRGDAFRAGRVDVTSDVLKAVSEFVGVGNQITVECDGEPAFCIAVTAPPVAVTGESDD